MAEPRFALISVFLQGHKADKIRLPNQLFENIHHYPWARIYFQRQWFLKIGRKMGYLYNHNGQLKGLKC